MRRKSLRLLRVGKNAPNPHVKTVAFMNIMQFFRKLTGKSGGQPELPDQMVHNLIKRLDNTQDEELSCDEVFALVDEYAEASQRGEDVASLKPLIRHHLDMCRECDEEYQALLRVLEGTASN